MKGNSSKVIVIGLDCATFEIINPLLKKGLLPNLQQIIEEGSSGILKSTMLPLSPTAWSSFMTGKNPGKHGVFDWRKRDFSNYHSGLVSSIVFEDKLLWDILGDKGKKVGIFNIPLTYPPREVNGFMVTGILTPEKSDNYTYPQFLGEQLRGKIGDYPVVFKPKYIEGKEENYLRDIKYSLKKRGEAIIYLMEEYNPDFAIFGIMETDRIQHEFWKYMDPTHPKHKKEEHSPYANAIFDIYKQIDSIIGQIRKRISEDTTLIIMSDHGAGPLYKMVYINKYLISLGLLNLKGNPGTLIKLLLLKMNIPRLAGQIMARLGLSGRFIAESKRAKYQMMFLSSGDIDWKRTKAYTSGDFGQISINLKGRESEGCVSSGKEYEELRNYMIEKLYELTDQDSNEKVVDRVYKREEIYHGKNLEKAPDIIFQMKEFSYISSKYLGLHSKYFIEKLGTNRQSGSHKQEGILIIKGQGVRSGNTIKKAELIDVAPTILYMSGIPIPKDMDGRVLLDIFTEEYHRNKPIQYEEKEIIRERKDRKVYSPEEEAELQKRLKDLGYLG